MSLIPQALTVMRKACELIQQNHGARLNLDTIPLDHPTTYELLSRGETIGIFQVESAGMRRMLTEMMTDSSPSSAINSERLSSFRAKMCSTWYAVLRPVPLT